MPSRRAARSHPERRRLAARFLGGIAAVVLLAACMSADDDQRAEENTSVQIRRLVEPGSRYVALGSSFASGPGLAPIVDADCGRSGNNYAARVARELALQLTDVSCTATTTDNIVTTPHAVGGDARRPQIEAVTAGTRLVTVTIGGNDIGYASLVDEFACIDTGGCGSEAANVGRVEEALKSVTTRLATALDTVRQAAPEAVVLFVTYPVIVPADGSTCPAIVLTPEHSAATARVAAELQTAFVTASVESAVGLVDAYRASFDHHACSSTEPWISGWVPDPNVEGVRSFHPTSAGMREVAGLVVDAVTVRG